LPLIASNCLSQDERTYHVLYQLCRGCSREQSTKLKLLPAADFHYLGDSAALGLVHASAHHDAPPTSPQVSGVDDVEWWAASCKAMDVFAIDDEDQLALQSVLAAVLHIGDLTACMHVLTTAPFPHRYCTSAT
jgi:myosin heavy subunit